MSEKTRQPTAQRLREARGKGRVAKSAGVAGCAQLLALLGYFAFHGGELLQALGGLVEVSIRASGPGWPAGLHALLGAVFDLVWRFGAPLALLVILTTVVATQVQTGLLFSPAAAAPSLERLSPLANLKQIVSLRSLFTLVKSGIELLLLFLLVYYLVSQYGASIQFLPLCPVSCGVDVSVRLLYWMWAVLIGMQALFAVADYAFQRHDLNRQLMMSVDDIRKEYEEAEGDPDIKQKRRETRQEMQSGSLAANVARSTVVVRNPSHLAVCLYYRRGETPLPRLLEVGHGQVALHIVRLAERAGVPVVENIDVARRLAAQTGVGGCIPAELFEPVAEILRLVMQLEYADGVDD
ncbi:EscU/YscU/HrcU family type III secretion system export apparatus switch protein [Microvirgula aerodenitrificans]|uniref:EscU/YscU/HrcU family type III secretion system export apparatus switch protein n=1 Tax=Microvirgula aerodenitrificans TaxID=57480 RepID=UPI00248E0C3E|nr:EscU/YscU/HrcU family type III secretion system export apparatus switch protein [Microvirgula aerodenitrificans]